MSARREDALEDEVAGERFSEGHASVVQVCGRKQPDRRGSHVNGPGGLPEGETVEGRRSPVWSDRRTAFWRVLKAPVAAASHQSLVRPRKMLSSNIGLKGKQA
jgi:hypothetical protein